MCISAFAPRFTFVFLPENKKKDDNFGQNDDDWDVYKEIVSV